MRRPEQPLAPGPVPAEALLGVSLLGAGGQEAGQARPGSRPVTCVRVLTNTRPARRRREQDGFLKDWKVSHISDKSDQRALEAGVLSANELGPILSHAMYQHFLFFQRNRVLVFAMMDLLKHLLFK